VQLLEVFSSAASFAIVEPGAGDGVRAGRDVGRAATVFAARPDPCGLATGLCGLATGLCGLATCFGASTVMLGRVPEPVAVCDTAVPLRPHNNAVDRIATAESATRLDDILIRRFPKSGH
jgi:hypothetical protein